MHSTDSVRSSDRLLLPRGSVSGTVMNHGGIRKEAPFACAFLKILSRDTAANVSSQFVIDVIGNLNRVDVQVRVVTFTTPSFYRRETTLDRSNPMPDSVQPEILPGSRFEATARRDRTDLNSPVCTRHVAALRARH